MKKLLTLISILFFFSCDVTEPDTTPPTVTITSPTDNSTVYEVVTITCMSSDNEGVEKVELWVDGVSTNQFDSTEPYSFDWNTINYQNTSTHTIIIRSYDTSDNTTDSSPLTLIVNNQLSIPQSVSIESVEFENGGFNIDWSRSVDGDFQSYTLEHGFDNLMTDYEEIFMTEGINDTSFFYENVSPLEFHYFRVTVRDTFNYHIRSSVMSSSLDEVPSSVDVISVDYDFENMVITWDESNDTDFGSYKLLYSEDTESDRDTLVTITDIGTTSYSLQEFDPTHENWFWVITSDTLGQVNIGHGMSNQIDSPPHSIYIESINYENDSLHFSWSQNLNSDFLSYTIYESSNENMSDETPIVVIDNSYTTNYTMNIDDGLFRYYRIEVSDYWGLTTSSSIEEVSTHIKFIVNFGGDDHDFGRSVKQTNDDGYIITGLGLDGIYLIKTDSYGIEEWYQYYSYQYGSYDVLQTNDNGFIISGQTNSNEMLLIKTLSNGNIEWENIYSFNIDSGPHGGFKLSIEQTNDDGYIITGGGHLFGYNGIDVLLIKIDNNGNQEWFRTFDNSGSDGGRTVQQTSDGGYIITGYTGWFWDVWLIKTDSEGNEQWNRTFGGEYNDFGISVYQSIDEGYIIMGRTSSYGNVDGDIWLIKTDSQGQEEWNRIFNGTIYSGEKTLDDGCIIIGEINSDVLLIKIDLQGNEEWNQTFGGSGSDSGYSVQQTLDGGYIITGSTDSFGNGSSDVLLIKTDSNGNTVDFPQ